MLNDDGVVAFEFDAFLFPIFCEILNRHAGMANHIAWDVAVYREAAFPVAKSRILNRMGDNLWIVHDFLKAIGFFWWVAIGIFWIGNQNSDDSFRDIQLRGSESHSSTEAKFFSHNRVLRMVQELHHFFTQDNFLVRQREGHIFCNSSKCWISFADNVIHINQMGRSCNFFNCFHRFTLTFFLPSMITQKSLKLKLSVDGFRMFDGQITHPFCV